MTDETARVRGRKLGDRRVRVSPPHSRFFRYAGPSTLVARESASAPRTRGGRAAARVRALLLGRPLASHEEITERLNPLTGLSIFASDNISSSAYATEEIMRVLALAGAGVLALTLPITVAIVIVLAIVVTSYRQTIAAYPNGGGSYIVASENLGTLPGLTAAAALLTDYVLTVAVSVAAGVAALTSIVPELFPVRVGLGIAIVAVIALVNLRGIRESGLIFSVPTYVYLVAIFGILGIGLARYVTGTMPEYHPPAAWLSAEVTEPLGLLLILRAFASGSVALTGTEAVSNGVPAFKPPEARNAQLVITLMGAFFGLVFLGMSFLVGQLGILPDPTEQETVVSQLTRTFVGEGTPFHLLVQVSTAVLLVLAANTSFADFPRLSSILARDGFLPRVLQFRGDRLAFSGGIVVLAALSVALIAAFGGSVTALIPLYTVGVFIAFTLSQAGMVRHWSGLRDQSGWRRRAAINGLGAVTTAVVAVEVAVSKFALGAWVVLVLIPVLIGGMLFIRRQYRSTARQLAVRPGTVFPGPRRGRRVVIPVPGLNRAVVHAVNVGRSITQDVEAVLIASDVGEAEEVRRQWRQQLPWVPLTVVESPYRALVAPVLAYLDVLDQEASAADGGGPPITFVIIPEFVARTWWERVLYNQSARRLRAALLGRRRTVVVNVPYRREEPEPVAASA